MRSRPKWASVDMSLATDADKHLRTFDYTKLSSINMCPTYGIVRYTHHKVMPGGGRSMALEAGLALHDCFAAIRLVSLGHPRMQNLPQHMHTHGVRLFGEDRWASITTVWDNDSFDHCLRKVALECLDTFNYVDDPHDNRRTYVNLETSLLYYLQLWNAKRYPVWVRDVDDPTSDVGIEIPFAIKIQPWFTHEAGYGPVAPVEPFLYTGRIDGIHVNALAPTELLIQENKTASRLSDAWRMSFDMSHQVTGYTIAASLFSGSVIERGLVIGLALPLPRNLSEGLVIEGVRRHDYMKARWLEWLEYTVNIHDTYAHDPLNAPKHTHSCNRYFRPCSFIPLCASDPDEQKQMLAEMPTDEWSPLADKTGD